MRQVGLILLLVASCQKAPDDLGPFAIEFQFDQRPGSQCPSESCSDYGMRCGAALGIRILDVADDGRIVADACFEVPPADTLCGLGNVTSPTFFNIPAHRLRIEAAAWRPEVLEADPELAGDCPDDTLFDVRGVPLETFRPRPAFAGAAYFDAATDADVALVPLSCTDADQLDDPDECGLVDTTPIRVTADDIETALDITSEQAGNLTVGLAEPRAIPDGDGGMVYVIEGSDTIPLTPELGPVPSFTGQTEKELEDVCSVLLELTPQSTASVTCERLADGADEIDVRGVLVSVDTLDQVLAAMGADTFPPEGLVVGRVVDHTGTPLANVDVMPTVGTVEYLSADRSTLIGGDTTASGLFIARDVPFGSTWTALHNGDGRRQEGTIRGGLVEGKVTALLVRMQPPDL